MVAKVRARYFFPWPKLWAAHSNGKALYLMAEKQKDGMSIAEQIGAVVAMSEV
jgi:hypothetical protein